VSVASSTVEDWAAGHSDPLVREAAAKLLRYRQQLECGALTPMEYALLCEHLLHPRRVNDAARSPDHAAELRKHFAVLWSFARP
jgi:hypothetical protein